MRVCIRLVLQPARECRFATSLSCSPHASAGLHPRCLVAAHTHVQVCSHVIMQPTRKCGFASRLLAAHTRVQVCIHLVVQPTHKCGFAPTLCTCLVAQRQARCDYVVNPAHSPGPGHTQAQSYNFAPPAAAQAHSTCHAAPLTPVRLRAVTAMLRELAAPLGRSSSHSTQASAATKSKI